MLLSPPACRADAPRPTAANSAEASAPSPNAPVGRASADQPPSHAPAARRYRVGNGEIEVRLVPEQTRVAVGEPLVVAFEIENLSDGALEFQQGGTEAWQLRKHDLYRLSATGPDAAPLAIRAKRSIFSGVSPALTLAAKSRFRKLLLAQNWVSFERVGRHRIRVDQQLKPLDAESIESVAEAEIEVVAADPEAITRAIERFAKRMLEPDEERATIAARALSHVDDARVIAAFDRALDATSISVRVAAVDGVAAVSRPQALAVLARALKSREPSVRHAAAWALERRKEPQASVELAALSRDPDVEIRLIVVRALGKRDDATASELLNDLAHDKNPRVSREAQSALFRGFGDHSPQKK